MKKLSSQIILAFAALAFLLAATPSFAHTNRHYRHAINGYQGYRGHHHAAVVYGSPYYAAYYGGGYASPYYYDHGYYTSPYSGYYGNGFARSFGFGGHHHHYYSHHHHRYHGC